MSVQFGRWNFDGQPSDPNYIERVSATLAPYGPDTDKAYSKDGTSILYRAFCTTKESWLEKQPHISSTGVVFTWDGRLDNRVELIDQLRDSLTPSSTDVATAAAAYEKWGTNCFARFIGDWALSIWNPIKRCLTLAKDPIGTRHLYYSFDNNQVSWSTILDPLVLFAGKTVVICEEYIAGWYSYFPAAHLTPYVGINAVQPSFSVLLQPGKHIVSKYWDFDPEKKTRYRNDAEYEEHFRTVFAKAVERNLRSDSAILAHLSGGMDSSSIVCMADLIIARGGAETPRLDTMSWYNDFEPGLNERPYFAKVEEKRGRIGHHIDLGALRQNETDSPGPFTSEFVSDSFAATPNPSRRHTEFCKRCAAIISQRYRVTLSGIGGELPTGGGVPTPVPELQDLLSRARFLTLARQLNAWSVKMRKPRLRLLWETALGFFPPALVGMPKQEHNVPWFRPGFARRNHAALCGYPSRVRLFGPLPSFQGNVRELNDLRNFLESYPLPLEALHETRFPYLDRDFLEFMYAVPRDQIVRVGQRRSLMKRALLGIVPDEVLNRKQKLYVSQEPIKRASAEWPSLAEVGQHLVSNAIGLIDRDRFLRTLQKARWNEDVPTTSLKRTLTLESWLRHLTIQGVLSNSMSTRRQNRSSSLKATELAPAQPKSSAS